MIRAVIYARYSSAGQRDESIEGQLRDCRKYAKQNGMTVVREYADRAISGTTDQRPEFQRMIADACNGLTDVVICWKVDRFARSRMHAAVYREQLKKHSVKIAYAMETIPDEPMGIVIESLMEGWAEFYSANLSQNIKRGNYDSAIQHQTLGVRVFGYSEDANKHYIINKEEAEWVRYVFESVIKGASFQSIVAELKRNRVRNKTGNYFNTTALHRMIENPKYKGTYTYSNISEDDTMPAIVTKEEWAEAQSKAKSIPQSHRHIKKRGEENFILSGRLFCGHCGGNMIGDCGTNKAGKIFNYYSCQHKKHGRTCKKKSVRKEYIEDMICKALWEFVDSEDNVSRIVDTAFEIQMQRRDSSTISLIEKEIADVERKRNNIIKAIEEGISGLGNRMAELNAEIERLANEKAREEFNCGTVISKEDIREYVESFRLFGCPEDMEIKEKLVRAFLKKAIVYDDRVEIYFDCNGLSITVDFSEEEKSGEVFDYQNISSTKRNIVEQWKIVVLL